MNALAGLANYSDDDEDNELEEEQQQQQQQHQQQQSHKEIKKEKVIEGLCFGFLFMRFLKRQICDQNSKKKKREVTLERT